MKHIAFLTRGSTTDGQGDPMFKWQSAANQCEPDVVVHISGALDSSDPFASRTKHAQAIAEAVMPEDRNAACIAFAFYMEDKQGGEVRPLHGEDLFIFVSEIVQAVDARRKQIVDAVPEDEDVAAMTAYYVVHVYDTQAPYVDHLVHCHTPVQAAEILFSAETIHVVALPEPEDGCIEEAIGVGPHIKAARVVFDGNQFTLSWNHAAQLVEF